MKRILNNKTNLGIVFIAIIFLIGFKATRLFSIAAKAQPLTTSGANSESVLLKQIKASQLTMGDLMDALSSSDSSRRKDAVVAILALRSHYMSDAAQIAFSSSSKKADVASTSNALKSLAYLRPDDPSLLLKADKNIDIASEAGPTRHTVAPFGGVEHPVAGLLVRASFAALPILRNDFRNNLIQSSHSLTEQQRLRLQCAAVILGPCAPYWFRTQAANESDPAIRQSMLYCLQIVSAKQTSHPGEPPPPPGPVSGGSLEILRGFRYTGELDEEIESSDLDQIDPSKYTIQWNVSSLLADDTHFATDRPVPPWPSERSSQSVVALHEIERTISLLSYNICLRLNSDSNIKTKQKLVPFSTDAAIDAVRVLGLLRSNSFAPYIIWQRLRQASMKTHIENDASTNVLVCVRALGQIDDPAANILASRVTAELSPDQQYAATYSLGKVLGRYAVPYIDNEIVLRQQSIKEATDQEYNSQYLDEIALLTKMMNSGKERGWFQGDLYGVGDPRAYDLQLDADGKSIH